MTHPTKDEETMDLGNKFCVGVRGKRVCILRPQVEMSAEEALNLAAWLVAMAEFNTHAKFEDLLEKVRNT